MLVEVHIESIVSVLGEHVLPERHSSSFFGGARVSVRVSASWVVFASSIVPGFVEVGLVSAVMGVECVGGTGESAGIASGSERHDDLSVGEPFTLQIKQYST